MGSALQHEQQTRTCAYCKQIYFQEGKKKSGQEMSQARPVYSSQMYQSEKTTHLAQAE